MGHSIEICYNDVLFQKGIKKVETWTPEKVAHMAVSGRTGTGKTIFTKVIMLSILMNYHKEQVSITVCDFKGDEDFSFLDGYKNYYRFEEVKRGFDTFYKEFESRQRAIEERIPTFIFFDEWASFLNFCDKREAEAYKQKMSNLLMLGRSFDVHVVLSQQRLDAESFGKSRDNFGVVIALGNLSKEVVGMLFSEYKDEIIDDRECGSGYMLVEGSNFVKIRIPYVRSIELLDMRIKQRFKRSMMLGDAEGEAEREPDA